MSFLNMTAPILYRAMPEEIVFDEKEALAFLGASGLHPDERLCQMLARSKQELSSSLIYRACALELPLAFEGEGMLSIGDLQVKSKDLSSHLQGCSSVLLMAATVGIEADRKIAAKGRISAFEGALFDALASVAIEAWCDKLEEKLTAGITSRPRYSPGYGDLSLSFQAPILSLLNAGHYIGLTVTKSEMLSPTKSVTAVIGIA